MLKSMPLEPLKMIHYDVRNMDFNLYAQMCFGSIWLCLNWFNEIYCWNVDVHGLMITMVCSIDIFGKNWEITIWDATVHETLAFEFPRFFPIFVLPGLNSLIQSKHFILCPKRLCLVKWIMILQLCHSCSIYFILISHFITNLPKIITCSFLIQIQWDFLCCVHHDLYFFIIIFPEFLDE